MNRLYFAGSVGKHDWRNNFAIEANGRIMSEGYAIYTTPIGGKFIYGGPFAISCDHGCFHFSLHGFGSGCGSGSYMPGPRIGGSRSSEGESSHYTYIRCLGQIGNCDAVIANITRIDSYGTYLEIGYALALSKIVYLYCPIIIDRSIPGEKSNHGMDTNADDLWFIKAGCEELKTLEIPSHLLEFNNKSKYQEYLQTLEWKSLAKAKRISANNKCQLCNNGNDELHVHHRTYDNVYHEELDDLIVLCKQCHSKFHEKEQQNATNQEM